MTQRTTPFQPGIADTKMDGMSDDYAFNLTTVPEPGNLLLVAIAGLVMMRHRTLN